MFVTVRNPVALLIDPIYHKSIEREQFKNKKTKKTNFTLGSFSFGCTAVFVCVCVWKMNILPAAAVEHSHRVLADVYVIRPARWVCFLSFYSFFFPFFPLNNTNAKDIRCQVQQRQTLRRSSSMKIRPANLFFVFILSASKAQHAIAPFF